MSRHEIATRKILFTLPGMESVRVTDGEFRGVGGELLPMALYYPAAAIGRLPAVLIVEGYPDPGFERMLGCRFMEMEWSISLARLIAASGMVVVTYANRQPAGDAVAVLSHVRSHAESLGIDGGRIGLWATSGHGPVALWLLHHAVCAVLTNPLTLDIGGATHVADAAKTFRFDVPAIEELPAGRPIFVVRAGMDETPGLNHSLDRFVAHALSRNLPITLVNHPPAPHSFELVDDGPATGRIIGEALSFLAFHLELSHTGGDRRPTAGA